MLEVISAVLTASGDILIGISILKVHEKFSKERRVDDEVIEEIKDEHTYVYSGILLIFAGLLMQIIGLFLGI